MPTSNDRNPTTAAGALATARIIWFAMMMGELIFLAVILFVVLPHRNSPPEPNPILVYANVVLLLTSVPMTFMIRRFIFKKAETDGATPGGAYFTGNVIFWAGCEGACFFALAIVMITGSLWPTILIAAIALCLQAITFPVGGDCLQPSANPPGQRR
jgi:hypothetical protein